MRNLVIFVSVVAALWSGWWYVGSSAHEAAIKGWLSQQRKAGWVAEYETLDVAGYPNRFDTRVRGLTVADPASGWAWNAPEFQVLSQSYTPNHIIAAWPGPQRLSSRWETVTAEARVMRGSIVFEPDTQLALDRSAIEIEGLTLRGASGWTATLEDGLFATRQSEPGTAPDFAHDVSFNATNLTLPLPVKNALDPAGLLPGALKVAELSMTPVFSSPWNRQVVESGQNPELRAINLRSLTITWGKLDLRAKGKVDIDPDGYPNGSIDVTARNWQDMLDLAVRSGMLGRDVADAATSALRLMARLSSERDTVVVPLGFSGGYVRLGPIPIGRAPRFR